METLPLVLTELIKAQRERLECCGRIIEQSGSDQAGGVLVSLHSDYGPPDQDKGAKNQDFGLIWCSSETESASVPRLVIAIADGVTASSRSEWGASLACWMAVRTLVERSAELLPFDLAQAAFDAAGRSIGEVADVLAANPQESRPAMRKPSTWQYILGQGKLLQTTLMLAWLDQNTLRIASVGDGGAVWRGLNQETQRETCDQVFAHCDLETNQVNCLGPSDRAGLPFDVWIERPIDGPFLCAFYTDGVGRSLGDTPLTLLDGLEQMFTSNNMDISRSYLEKALSERPQDFIDNITLASLRYVCDR